MTSSLTPQEEIQRLNSIITVLLEQVAALKRENAALRTVDGIENKIYTSDKNMEGVKHSNHDPSENIEGIKYSNHDHPENIGGINYPNNGHPENIEGVNYPNHDHPENIGGINYKKYDYPENIGGINHKNQDVAGLGDSISAKDLASGPSHNALTGQNSFIHNMAPGIIEANDANITTLASYVRGNLHTRVPNNTCESVAGELLFIHNNGTASGHELRRTAGLSVSGFSKHLPMIKSRNFIYKKGVKKYALTQFSIQLINKAFGTT